MLDRTLHPHADGVRLEEKIQGVDPSAPEQQADPGAHRAMTVGAAAIPEPAASMPLILLYASALSERSEPLIQLLTAEGYSVVCADHLDDAVTQLHTMRPQLLIADWDLAGGGGLQLLKLARCAPSNSELPVLLTCQGDSWLSCLRESVDNGGDDCMAMPLDIEIASLRIRSLRRIAAAQSRLRSIIDNVREGVITIDGQGTVLSYNAAAAVIFGYGDDEVIGSNVRLLMPSPHRDQHDSYLAAFLSTRRPKIIGVGRQISGRRKSGEVFPMSLAVAEIKATSSATFIGLIHDLSAEREQQQLAHLASHDSLTGLPNRARFMAVLDEAMGPAGPRSCALLFIDVDRFKHINDELGHAAGDAVLTMLAERVKRAISQTDLVARLAGDEFVVLLRDVTSLASAQSIAQRLAQNVAAPMTVAAHTLTVCISIGVAFAEPGKCSGPELLAEADKAMYEVKRRGGTVAASHP